mmetsp:Transcript_18697/g.33831  ORF Transcript_18697/g.33831 Transcript_18697/m.33831 type:complete len:123 (+) Transcript_18697:2750-3118(+)
MNLREGIWFCFFIGFTYELVVPYTRPPVNEKEPVEAKEPYEEPVKRTEVFESEHPIPIFDATGSSGSRDAYFRHPLVISYCQTCAYKAKVDEIRLAALNTYPMLSIVDEDHPVGFPWDVLSQ